MGEVSGQAPAAVADKGPAVLTKPLPDRESSVASGTTPASPAKPAVTGGQSTSSAGGVPAKPQTDDAETKAQRVLNLARTYIKAGMKDKGMAKLREVAESYAGTGAAKEASELLTQYQ